MPGMQARVYEKNTLVFTSNGAGQIPAGKSVVIPIALNIDTSRYLYGTMVLRVHAFSASGGTGTAPTVALSLYASAPTSEDPANVFRTASPLKSGTALSPGAPQLAIDTTETAGFTDLLLTVTGYGSTAGDITVTISVDIVLKS